MYRLIMALTFLISGPALAATAKPAPVKVEHLDARSPASLIALLGTMNAKAEITRQDADQIFLVISTSGGKFGAQMVNCDASGATCQGLALFSTFDLKGPNLAEINDFNRSQLACRGILTPEGKPSVMYSTLLNGRMTREDMQTHIGVWQGCLASFGEFTRDPIAFLSKPHI